MSDDITGRVCIECAMENMRKGASVNIYVPICKHFYENSKGEGEGGDQQAEDDGATDSYYDLMQAAAVSAGESRISQSGLIQEKIAKQEPPSDTPDYGPQPSELKHFVITPFRAKYICELSQRGWTFSQIANSCANMFIWGASWDPPGSAAVGMFLVRAAVAFNKEKVAQVEWGKA